MEEQNRGPGPPVYEEQDFAGMEEKFAEQQKKITELKEKVRKSEADKKEKVSSAKLKADQYLQKLTSLRSGVKKNKSELQANKHKEYKTKQLQAQDASASDTPKTSKTTEESPISETPKKLLKMSTPEIELTADSIMTIESTTETNEESETQITKIKIDPRTPRSEKIMLLKKQTEENRKTFAERLSNQKGIELKVNKLREQFDDVQTMLTPENMQHTKSVVDVKTIKEVSNANELLEKIKSLELTIVNLNVKLNNKSKNEIADLLSSDLSYIDIQNELNLDDKKMLQYMQNLLTIKDAEKNTLQNEVLDLKENIKDKDCVIDAKTKAITLMSENLSLKGKNTVDLLEETKLEMSKMQSNFIQVESELRKEIQALIDDNSFKHNALLNLTEINNILEQTRYELTVKNADLEQQLSDKTKMLEKYESDLNVKSSKINELNELNESLLNKLADLENQKFEIIPKHDIESVKLSTDTEIEAEKLNTEELNYKIKELQEYSNDLKRSNTELQKTIDILDLQLLESAQKIQTSTESEVVEQPSTKPSAKRGKGKKGNAQRQASDLAKSKSSDNLQMKIEELEESLNECKTYIVIKDEENQILQAALDEKLQEISYLHENASVMKNALSLAELSSDSMDEGSKVKKEIEVIASNKKLIKHLQKQVDSFSKISDANREVILLTNRVAELSQKVVELEEEKGNLQLHLVDYDSNKVPDGDLRNKLIDLQATCQNQIQSIELLETQKFDLVQELHASKQQITLLEDQLSDFSQYDTTVSSQITTIQLEENLEKLTDEKQELLDRLAELTMKNSNYEITLQELMNEKDDLSGKLEACLCENIELIKKIDRIEKLTADKVSSAESIEMVDNLTHEEKIEIEEYNKKIAQGGRDSVPEHNIDEMHNEPTAMSIYESSVITQTEVSQILNDYEDSDLNRSVAKLTEESAELMDKIELFTQERREVMGRMDTLMSTNQMLLSKVEENEDNFEKISQAYSELKENNIHLVEKLEDLKQEREELQSTVQILTDDRMHLQDEISLLQDEKGSKKDTYLSSAGDIHHPVNVSELVKTIKIDTAGEVAKVEDSLILVDSEKSIDKEKYLEEIRNLKLELEQLQGIRSELEAILNEKVILENNLIASKSENINLKQQNEEFNQGIEKLTNDIIVLKNNMELITDEYEHHKQESFARDVELKNVKYTCENQAKTLEELNMLIVEQKHQIISIVNDFEEKSADSNEKLMNYEKLVSANVEYKHEIEILTEDNKALRNKLSESNAAEHLEAELTELKMELDENRMILASYDDQMKNNEDTINTLNSQIMDLYKNMEGLNGSLQEKNEEINELLKTIEINNDVIHKLNSDVSKKDSEIDELCVELKEMHQEIDNAKSDLPKLEDISKPYEVRISELEELVAALENKNKEQLEKMKKLAANFKKKATLCLELENNLKDMQSKVMDYENQIQELQHENNKSTAEVQQSNDHQMMQVSLFEELEALKLENNNLKDEKNEATFALMARLEEEQTRNNHYSIELQKLHEENQQLSSKLAENETIINDLSNLRLKYEAQIQDLSMELNSNKVSATNEIMKQISDLENVIQNKELTILNLNDKILEYKNNYETSLDGLKAKLAEKEVYIETIENENVYHKEKISKLVDGIACIEERRYSLERRAQILDEQLEEKSRESSEFSQNEDILVRRLNALVDQDDILEQKLDEALKENEELNEKIKELQDKNEDNYNQLQNYEESMRQSMYNESFVKETEIVNANLQAQIVHLETEMKKICNDYESTLTEKHKEIDILETELGIQLQIVEDEKKIISESLEKTKDMNNDLQDDIVRLKDCLYTSEQNKSDLERENTWIKLQNENLLSINNEVETLRSQINDYENEIRSLHSQLQDSFESDGLVQPQAICSEPEMPISMDLDTTEKLHSEIRNLKTALLKKTEEIEIYQRRNMQLQMAASFGSQGGALFESNIQDVINNSETEILKSQLSGRNDEIRQYINNMEVLNQQIAHLQNELGTVNQHLIELKEIIIQKDSCLLELNQLILQKDMNASMSQDSCVEKDLKIAELNSEISKQKEDLLIFEKALEGNAIIASAEEQVTCLRTRPLLQSSEFISFAKEAPIAESTVEQLNTILTHNMVQDMQTKIDELNKQLLVVMAERNQALEQVMLWKTNAPEKNKFPLEDQIEHDVDDYNFQVTDVVDVSIPKQDTRQEVVEEFIQPKSAYLCYIDADKAADFVTEIEPDIEDCVDKNSMLKHIESNAEIDKDLLNNLQLKIKELEDRLSIISKERDEALARVDNLSALEPKSLKLFSDDRSIHLSLEDQIEHDFSFKPQVTDVVDVSLPKTDHKQEIVAEVLRPKKAYLCEVCDNEKDISVGSEEGWGWGSEEAILEEKHQMESQSALPCNREQSLTEIKLTEAEEKLQVFEFERVRLHEEMTALQVKAGKLLKKLKEYKVKNDSLEARIKMQSYTEPNDLDFAIQQELSSQVKNLEDRIKEVQVQKDKEQLEKASLNKRIDILSNANEKMIENKERQDLEIERLNIKIKQLNNQFEWGFETKEQPEKKQIRTVLQEALHTSDEHQDIANLNSTINDLSIDNEELQALLDEQRIIRQELEQKIAKMPDINNYISQDEFEIIKHECNKIKEEMLNITAQKEEMSNMYESIIAERDNFQRLLNTSYENLKELSLQFQTLQNEKQTLNDVYNAVCANETEHLKTITVLSEERTALITELNSLKLQMYNRTESMEHQNHDKFESDLELKLGEIIKLTNLSEQQENDLNNLENTLQMYKEQNTNLNNSLEVKDNEITKLNQRLTHFKGQHVVYQSELNELLVTVQNYEVQIKSLTNELDLKSSEISKMSTSLEQSQVGGNELLLKDIEHKNNEINRLNAIIEDLTQRLNDIESSFQMNIDQLNEQWSTMVDQRGNDVAESWKIHLENREREFQQIESNLRTELNTVIEKYNYPLDQSMIMQENDQQITSDFTDQDKLIELNQPPSSRTNEIENLSQQLSTKNSEVEILNQQLNNKNDEIESLLQQLSDKNSEMGIVNQHLSNKNNETENLNQQLSSKNGDIVILNQQLSKKNNEIENLNQQLSSKNSDMGILNQQLSNKNNEIEILSHQLSNNQELDILNHQLSRKDNEIENLNQQLSSKNGDIVILNQQLSKKNNEIENLNQQLSSKSNDMEILNQQLSNKNNEIEILSHQFSNSKELDILNQQLSYKNNEIGILNHQLSNKNNEIDILNRQLNDLNNEKEVLIEQLNNKNNDIEILNQQLSNLHYDLEIRNQQLIDKNDEIEMLGQQISNKNDVDILNQQLSSKNNENEILIEQLRIKENEIEMLGQQVNINRHEIDNIRRQLDELKDQDEEYKLQIVGMKIELERSESNNQKIYKNCEEINTSNDELKKQYEKLILDNEIKYKELVSEKEMQISKLTADLQEAHSVRVQNSSLHQSEEQLRELLQQKELEIGHLKDSISNKEHELEQKVEEYGHLLNEKYDEINILNGKLRDMYSYAEQINLQKDVELQNYRQQQEIIIEIKDTDISNLQIQLNAKISENLSLATTIDELNKLHSEEHKQLLQMRSVLENQEYEIVSLKQELESRIKEFNKIAQQLDPFSAEIQEELTLSSARSPSVSTVVSETNISESSRRSSRAKLDGSVKSELDLALYMLHQRDVRCEELTFELMHLLDERDTLQLRLSNAIRINEDMRSKYKPVESAVNTELSGNEAASSVGENQPLVNIANADAAITEARTMKIVPLDQYASLRSKLSELHSVDQSRDMRIMDERLARSHQMRMIEKDFNNLPQEAMDRLVGADYTLSRDTQSPSTVLLNWIWGKSTPKIEHL